MYPTDLNGIYFNGIYIHEPMGLLTNFIMAVAGIALFLKLRSSEHGLINQMAYFLLFLGLASVGGIFTHGFPTYLGETGFFWLWSLKNTMVPIANYFAVMGLISALNPERASRLKPWMGVKIIAVSSLLVMTFSFLPAVIDLAFTYILALTLCMRARKFLPGAIAFRNAFAIAILSGTFYVVRWDIHPLWMNHKDIVHLFVLLSMWYIYRGIRAYEAGLSATDSLPEMERLGYFKSTDTIV